MSPMSFMDFDDRFSTMMLWGGGGLLSNLGLKRSWIVVSVTCQVTT